MVNQELVGVSVKSSAQPLSGSGGKLLILEDNPDSSSLYEYYCKKMNIPFDLEVNGVRALERIESSSTTYAAYVVDLFMPEQDGITFVTRLKEIDPDAIIIIQTSSDVPDKIIEVMKLGVFDYLIKPINMDAFEKSIRLALKAYNFKHSKRQVEKINRDVLRNQLEWLTYKESIRKSDESSILISTIKSLSTSFSQGSGLGALVSLLDLLKLEESNKETSEQKSSGILNLLFSNQEIVRKQLDGLSAVLSIAEQNPPMTQIGTTDLRDILIKRADIIHPFLSERETRIRFSSFKNKHYVSINKELIAIAFEELLLNALKYGREQSYLDIYFNIVEGYFCITVKNTTDTRQELIDPETGEILVTRPFYRLLPPVEHFVELERYGLGLGLTAVELIVSKHRGIFHIHNVADHTRDQVENSVMAEMFLPLDESPERAS
ncbi:histidine kinase [Leptospira perolatii]|uniref:Histidine kinase n=1 Tax=Leptospira perolatii TaxID=2023191 RepID=A0A2M9ZJS3_9LEPT|nr:response regulator [Leptospira perolatii]PJZ69481.1 histidine kinase [Leptospira perolatii]PJZ72306.1 histidine kinase [Leptospira perolatii]